ncbi:response regulator [Pseudomonas sp. NPDC087346]|uniref:hybrid sensor histidine kinase/response regulator n=1 Tax=Pseudomonas sp. NPDC087346 TaxID=3364438 RepID=UPI0038001E20
MKQSRMTLDNLTRSSMRLNKGLLASLGVGLLLVGFSYWAMQRLLAEEQDTVSFHFARLMENVKRHEAFLHEVSRTSIQGDLQNPDVAVRYTHQRLNEQGREIFDVREFSYSIPFSVHFVRKAPDAANMGRVFDLGVHLASLYSSFWSTSHYQAPQVFLFNTSGNFDIVVPSSGALHTYVQPPVEPFNDVVNRVARHFVLNNGDGADEQVHWEKYNVPQDQPRPMQMLAYVNVRLNPAALRIQGASEHVVVASLLNMDQVNDIERVMDWTIYDQLSLIAPNELTVIGSVDSQQTLNDGLNINRQGLVFKVSSTDVNPWVAIYTISFSRFFGQIMWPLLGLALLIVSSVVAGGLISRWYRRRVVRPAEQAHQHIAESEAFSRLVIDTAPTGLCVVRRTDFQVLLENQQARQWQGTAKLVALFSRRENLTDSGETRLEIDGRHLQVGFTPTRYQGQDALLCAFNDVTRHIEDAQALQEARHDADAANAAKTLFLATMSHEIRTPLYGVLGTLELLALTRLEPRQQGYLQTIERSSATLFQLISDVLDVSKIESGEMVIDLIEFCPLDLIEDTLHTYAAFAERKGLLLYACIDAALPDRLIGDPVRIRQILNNLLSNAIKFTDSGRVVLRVRVVEIEDDQASIEWQVTDSGIGISEAQQIELFAPFFQVRDASSEAGAGLGLAICQSLTQMMQGQLKVVSEPGLGSSFSLQLPFTQAAGQLAVETDCATEAVYVRAAVPELAQSVCAWLNRLGLAATLLPANAPATAVLVDILPNETTAIWHGPWVVALSNGQNRPANTTGAIEVDLFDLRAIARAVCLSQWGPEAQVETPQPSLIGLNLHVLVAEDNPINQAIIKEQLEALGCTVVATSNGEQALNQWQPQVFDLVLTDVNMPVINGYELARTLRRSDPRIPIIGITANAMREEGARCLEVGMNAWLVKPLSLHILREQMLKLCGSTAKTPVAPQPQPEVEQGDAITLSAKMRELFVTTMQQDIQALKSALEREDRQDLAQRLHSIAGAMGAVQARALADDCVELECQILEAPSTLSLQQQINPIVQRLEALLQNIEH